MRRVVHQHHVDRVQVVVVVPVLVRLPVLLVRLATSVLPARVPLVLLVTTVPAVVALPHAVVV